MGDVTILQTYDLVVLGDHLGGLAAAALLSKGGKRVLLFENTEDAPDGRPLEYLNAICGGPDKEAGLGRFFHDLGLSPFGPLGDDLIHFRPLHPPLQVLLPGHRVNIYQDRVAGNWEMEREFGEVEGYLKLMQQKEEIFREKLFRYRTHRLERERSRLLRTAGDLSRFTRFWAVRKEAESESFPSFLASLGLPPGLDDILAGQAQGVFRVLPGAMPWAIGLRAIQVLQGGLFQNSSGQSGILDGLKEAFRRSGGEIRPLPSLESVETSGAEILRLALAGGGRAQTGHLVVDLPLKKAAAFFRPEVVKDWQKKGLDQTEEEWRYGLMSMKIRRDWLPECMGRYLVVDPSAEGRQPLTILLALQPGEADTEEGDLGMEVLGLFRSEGGADEQKEALWQRLENIIPFLERNLVGEVRFRRGSFPCYLPRSRSWRALEGYYRTGRRSHAFRTRQVTFLRNEEYIATGLAEGLLTGIMAVK